MEKICENCGAENSDTSKFCKECGSELKTHPTIVKTGVPKKDNNKIIIIALIAVIALLAIGTLAYAGNVFKKDVPLETHDFEIFKMDTPVGSVFEEYTSVPSYGNIGGFAYLENVGKYSKEVGILGVSNLTLGSSVPDDVKFEKNVDGVAIFKDKDGAEAYIATKSCGNYDFTLMGSDPDTMVKMLNSVEITDEGSQSEPVSESQPTAQTQAPAPAAMYILGGSFSTGSSLEDKTYASIYVGPEHAGENVKIQIWYSRDGTTLNNGNMVPKTVDSSGYINVKSADAYSQYPDFAEINLYDTNGNLMDSVSVTLTPDSGTQSF